MDGDPFVGPYEDGWRMVCPQVGLRGVFFLRIFLPMGSFGALLVIGLFNWDGSAQSAPYFFAVIPLFAAYAIGTYLHITRIARPPRVLELRPDCVMLYEKGAKKNPTVDIPYTRDVEVNVFLKENVDWGEHGMLYGWTIRKGAEHIRLHPDENWDLWRLQELSRPILWLVVEFNMSRGDDLKRYISQLESGPDGSREPWHEPGVSETA
jgi:hypothetical protein